MYEALLASLQDIETRLLQDAHGVDTTDPPEGFNHFLYTILYGEKQVLDEETLHTMKRVLEVSSLLYNIKGERWMTDEQYDLLYELYDPVGKGEDIIGSPNSATMETRPHDYPDLKGTLNKIYSIKSGEVFHTGIKKSKRSLEEWVSYIEGKIGRPLTAEESKIHIQPKYDGVSVIFSLDENGKMIRALTRGDKDTGEGVDVTNAFQSMEIIFRNGEEKSSPKEMGLKTEILLSHSDFKWVKDRYGYATPLSAVSGILNSKDRDPELLHRLTIQFLRFQEKGSDTIGPIDWLVDAPLSICDHEGIEKKLEKIKKLREEIPIDGAVFILADERLRNLLGREDNRCIYEVAYKFPPEEKEGTLLDIEWSTGDLGSLTPVAKIAPLEIKGKTISSISLGSFDRFQALDLHRGDKILVKYEVIPYLDILPNTEHHGEKFLPPTHCPYCNSPVEGKPLKCTNGSCESKALGKLLNFIRKVGIAFLSDATVFYFFKKGYLSDLASIYELEKYDEELIHLPGFGKLSIYSILHEIQQHRTMPIHVFYGALGIPSIGRKIFEKVFSVYTHKEFEEIVESNDTEKLISIKGISDKTATALIDGVWESQSVIDRLRKFVTLEHYTPEDESKLSVYFTKCRHPQFSEFLKQNGIQTAEKFTKKVNYLIIPDENCDSKKIGKYDVPTLTLKDAMSHFGFFQ